MPDRKLLLERLERLAIVLDMFMPQCAELVRDVIELLKEQEGTINELQNAYGYLQKQYFEAQDKLLKEQETVNLYKCQNCGTWVSAENVVRCKDCRHFEPDGIYTVCYRHNGLSPNADWYCADGERQEGR